MRFLPVRNDWKQADLSPGAPPRGYSKPIRVGGLRPPKSQRENRCGRVSGASDAATRVFRKNSWAAPMSFEYLP